MTGALQVVAASGKQAVDPLVASVSIGGGSSGVTVNTPSGTTRSTPDGERFFLASVSGGTPPYSYSWERQNGDNPTSLESTTSSRAYVNWSGMDVIGSYYSTTARCRFRDANGNTTYTGVHVIGITRA